MIDQISNNPLSGLIILISLIIAITFHEYAHAWMANLRGDPTAKALGRLTLNPLAHLDPLGTLLLLLVGFGWGKPVPVDEFNLKNPDKDLALISIAGPGANLISAVIAAYLYRLPFFNSNPLLASFLYSFIFISLILAFFNLLPLYPLDGSKIWFILLPKETAYQVSKTLEEYSLLLLILLLLPSFNGQSVISLILNPIIQLSLNLLLP